MTSTQEVSLARKIVNHFFKTDEREGTRLVLFREGTESKVQSKYVCEWSKANFESAVRVLLKESPK